jgi:hypothetical protein
LASAATSKAEGSYCGEIIDHGEPSGYRVVGFDAATNTWTIIRNGTFTGKYLVVRLTIACQAHKYADGPGSERRTRSALLRRYRLSRSAFAWIRSAVPKPSVN